MTTRIMLLSAVAIMIGSSMAYGSPACMTKSEAQKKFPKAHLYFHSHGSERCWDGRKAQDIRALAAVPRGSPRPTPKPSPRQQTLEPTSRPEEAGPPCRFLPCE